MIVKIDKEKFKKTLGEYIKSDSDGVHPNVYHEIVELLDQATVKDGQEEDREECSYCGGDNSEIEHTHQQPNKPTPEPEECKHLQVAIVNKGVGKTLECKFCGKRFTMTAPTWGSTSKVPEKLDNYGFHASDQTNREIMLYEKLQELISYLKEKEA